MKVMVTAEQRDALYDQLLDRLSGIDDIPLAIKLGNHELAKRLGREYSDELRLLDDLGYGDGDGKPVELTVPAEVLRRLLPRLRQLSHDLTGSQESEWAEARQLKDRNRLVSEACEAVLNGLDEQGTSGPDGPDLST